MVKYFRVTNDTVSKASEYGTIRHTVEHLAGSKEGLWQEYIGLSCLETWGSLNGHCLFTPQFHVSTPPKVAKARAKVQKNFFPVHARKVWKQSRDENLQEDHPTTYRTTVEKKDYHTCTPAVTHIYMYITVLTIYMEQLCGGPLVFLYRHCSPVGQFTCMFSSVVCSIFCQAHPQVKFIIA